jgi:hypothetical protein
VPGGKKGGDWGVRIRGTPMSDTGNLLEVLDSVCADICLSSGTGDICHVLYWYRRRWRN